MDCDVDAFTFLAWAPIIEFEGAGGDIIDWEGRDLCWKASPDSLFNPWGLQSLGCWRQTDAFKSNRRANHLLINNAWRNKHGYAFIKDLSCDTDFICSGFY